MSERPLIARGKSKHVSSARRQRAGEGAVEGKSPRQAQRMSEIVVRGRGESAACGGVVGFERESTRGRKFSRCHSNQSMYVPDVRHVGDRCRDFVMALTPHPITCVRKCRAAILNLEHVPLVVLCTLTSTRMRHPRNQVVENQNSQLGPHRLGEGGDDHKERWFRNWRPVKLTPSHNRGSC